MTKVDIWQEVQDTIKKDFIPTDIILELTRRCNLRCIHCYNTKDQAELSLSQIKEIAGQLREAGTLFLTLTGGEILVREDFVEIGKFLRKAGFDIKMISNGTCITRQLARELKEISPSDMGISLQGATAPVHDAVTGVEGSFDKSLRAIGYLVEEKVPVHIKYTVMKENVDEYGKLKALAKELKVTYIVDPLISPKEDGSKEVMEHRLDKEHLKDFYMAWFEEFEKPLRADSLICEAGKTLAAISARGDVYPCIQLPIKVGNIFEKPFKEIWDQSPLFKKMRNMTDSDIKVCGQCPNAKVCTRCPGLSFLEDKDAFGPSSTACMVADFYHEFKK
jgi:radical SAM protein with 4Fe4S-binding SPASM domain